MYKGIGADRCKLMCISMAQVSSYKKLLQTAHNGSARRRDQDIQQFGAQLQILYKTRGRPGLVAAPSLQTKIHLRVALLCQTAGPQNASKRL